MTTTDQPATTTPAWQDEIRRRTAAANTAGIYDGAVYRAKEAGASDGAAHDAGLAAVATVSAWAAKRAGFQLAVERIAAGRCPDCLCPPGACDSDDEDACNGCSSCVDGCPLENCPVCPDVRGN